MPEIPEIQRSQERLPFSFAHWGVVPRVGIALVGVALIWAVIGALL